MSAVLFLDRDVLKRELAWMDEIVRARRPTQLPVVLARGEVSAVLRELDGVERLMASLLHVLNRGGRGVRSPLDDVI